MIQHEPTLHEPTLRDVADALARIQPYVHHTPTLTSRTLDDMAGTKLVFKCENFQVGGAFKARGAHNAVFSLSADERTRGVVTHSSGNHAAALALAARNAGTLAHVVMPHNALGAKVDSVLRLGGRITYCEPNPAARELAAAKVQAETGAALVHPFDDWQVIAGQATAALELVQDVPELTALVTPVGGGGLLAGTSVVGRHYKLNVYGAEPAEADDAYRSFRSGQIQPLAGAHTMADGLRTTLGVRPFELIRNYVTDIATVTEDEILQAMRLVWQVLKIVIEPSSAVPVAALLGRRFPLDGQRVGVILSGGNVDPQRLA